MHIPDGFLSTQIWALMWVASGLVLMYALSKVKGKLKEKAVPLMGLLAAFIFAAQMLNVPIGVGTSGHLLGATLAAVLLGPFAAMIVMSAVFIVQAIFFQDGGMTALGANIFNMGLIGAVIGYYVFRAINAVSGRLLVSVAIAAWCAVMLASIATAIELVVSGTATLEIVLPAMAGVHAVIGLVEAAITVAVLAYILKTRPDLMELPKA
jgi:cobalt/nickel transport system permease protein